MSTVPRDLLSEAAIRPASALPREPPFLTRIRLRAQRHVLWLRRLWAVDAGGALGLAISHNEVDRILGDVGALAEAERAFEEGDPDAGALAPAIEAVDRAAAADERLTLLRMAFDLADAEVDLLTLAVAVEADPWMRRVFGYIHDDATSGLPTRWLARQLFRWPDGIEVEPDTALVRWRLARPVDGQASPWSVSAAWAVDPHIARCLLHGVSPDPRLGDAVRLVAVGAAVPPVCLYPAELAEMTSFARAPLPSARREIALVGPPGSGRRTLAATLAAGLGVPLLIADAARLMGPDIEAAAAREAAILVARSARLGGAAIYWHDADRAPAAAWRDARLHAGLALFGAGAAGFAPPGDDRGSRRTVRLPPLTRAARADLWAQLSAAPAPPPVLDWALLPADLARAAMAAPAGAEAVIDACRATLPVDSASLASRLPRPYSWDDLVVTPALRRHLAEIEDQARLRSPVLEEWGFGRLCPMGRGLSVLFAGPSGTGKTMSAQILARALGMEIYRIDLAGVVSKYIGETEKNLRQVFDACERANVLLFFDEADALFGKRTQVKDAHDRFANIEIDYLLQRMEQFDGVAVLATNRRSDIDVAFVRRLRFVVEFQPPGVAERRRLWTLALPAHAPDGEPLLGAIDWDALAQRLEMTGADIKAAALGAAFLARSEGTAIQMSHVTHAARRQLQKRTPGARVADLGG
jgi:AAA+ superfamily predicted ATPase